MQPYFFHTEQEGHRRPQLNNKLVLNMDRFFYCTHMDRGPPNKWKLFVGNRVTLIQEETASASWRHVPSQSNPADLISRGIEPTTLSTSTLVEGTTMAFTGAI